MNFDFLKNYNWKEIHDEWYGEKEEKPKPIVKTFGKPSKSKPRTVLLENEHEIIECASQREASFQLECSRDTIHNNSNKQWGFRGYKITKI